MESISPQSFQIRRSPTKLQKEYADKIQLIDRHLNKKQDILSDNETFQHTIKLVSAKSQTQPIEQILPFTPKTIIFDRPSTRKLLIRQHIAPPNRQFVLHVGNHVPVKLVLKVNDQQTRTYALSGSKAVILSPAIRQVSFSLQMQKVGLFFSVKLLLNHMKMQSSSSHKHRIKIDQELNDFLSATRGKSFEILRSRSQARLQQAQIRKTSVMSISSRNVMTAQTKSQLQHFERQKSLYLQNVGKMSPERVNAIHQNKQKYHCLKKQQIARLCNFILIAKLGIYLRTQALIRFRKDIRIIKTTMLCLDFIKIIKNKFKLKMTEKARSRMVTFHTLQFLPLFIRPTALKQARKTIYEGLTPFMDFRMMQELVSNSEYYIQKTKLLQQYFRKKIKGYRQRVMMLIERLLYKLKIDLTQQQKMQVCDKYTKRCIKITKSTPKFYGHKDYLVELLLTYPEV